MKNSNKIAQVIPMILTMTLTSACGSGSAGTTANGNPSSLSVIAGSTIHSNGTLEECYTNQSVLGDNSNRGRKLYLTFSLSSFASTSISKAELNLNYVSNVNSPVTSLGKLALYTLTTPTTSFSAGTYSASESFESFLIESQATINAYSASQTVTFDVTTPINAGLANGDSYVTLVVHFETLINNGNSELVWDTCENTSIAITD